MAERDHPPAGAGPTRRAVLLGAGAIGAAGLLGACADEPNGTPGATAPEPPLGPGPDDPSVIHTTDIPLGGGVIFTTLRAVVTQPSSGTFRGFDATCTHMNCLVGTIENGQIVCPCHGSRYRISDGSVVNGPATQPLPARLVTVAGDVITIT
jgi:Rieske Fe-S protein